MTEKKFVAILVLTFAFVMTGYCETHVEGNVEGVWNMDGSPFIVEGDLTVTSSDTLTIESGVQVLFNGEFNLNVRGILFALGGEGDSIYFGPVEDDAW